MILTPHNKPMFRLAALFLAAAGFVVVTHEGSAGAAPSAAELITEGLNLRRAGQDADALPKFEAAYAAEKTPRAAAQLGLCLQALGRWSEADPLLAESLLSVNDPWVKKNRDTIKDSLEEVKSHVGRVEVLGEPAGAVVLVAGRRVGTLPLAKAVVVNEGAIDVELSLPGYKRAEKAVNVAGGSYQRVVLRLEALPAQSHSQDKQRVFRADAPVPDPDPAPSEETPSMLSATSEPAKPITKNPWFWAGVGVVVVGAIATVVILSGGTTFPKPDEVRSVGE